MSVTGTALYAGILAVIYILLSARVSQLRRQTNVGIGDGDQPDLARAVRVHGNFGEYVPMTLVLLLIVENGGLAAWVTHALGIALVAGRVLHAYGLSTSIGVTAGRFIGTLLSWLALLIGGALSIYIALQ